MTFSQRRSPEQQGAPLPLVIFLQAVGGLLTGAVFGAIGSSFGSWLLANSPQTLDQAVGGVAGILLAYPLGLAFGVSSVGGALGRPAPLWAASLGAALGTWAPLLVLALGVRGDVRLLWGALALSSVLTVLGFHHWRLRRERGNRD